MTVQVCGIVAKVFCARGRGGVWWKSAFSRLVRRIFLLRIAVGYGGELENKNNNNGTSARVAAGWRTWWPISGGSECGRRSSRKRCDESFSFLFRVQKIILFKAKEKVSKISQLTLRLDGKRKEQDGRISTAAVVPPWARRRRGGRRNRCRCQKGSGSLVVRKIVYRLIGAAVSSRCPVRKNRVDSDE